MIPGTWRRAAALGLAVLVGCAAPTRAVKPTRDPELVRAAQTARAAFERGALWQAIPLYERALVRAHVIDDPVEIGDAAYNLAACLAAAEEYDRARILLGEAKSEMVRAKGNLADVLVLEAKVALGQRQLAQALLLAEQVESDSASIPTESHRVQAAVLRGTVAAASGDPEQAKVLLRAARQRIGLVPDPAVGAEVERLAGRIAVLQKQPEAAAAAFDRETQLWKRARRYAEMARALSRAGEAYQAADQGKLAAERFFRAARSSWAQGDQDTAAQHMHRAISLAERSGDAAMRQRAISLQEEMSRRRFPGEG